MGPKIQIGSLMRWKTMKSGLINHLKLCSWINKRKLDPSQRYKRPLLSLNNRSRLNIGGIMTSMKRLIYRFSRFEEKKPLTIYGLGKPQFFDEASVLFKEHSLTSSRWPYGAAVGTAFDKHVLCVEGRVLWLFLLDLLWQSVFLTS